jgi:pimeloyl-ACP methyl ester carboxylesterase/DNA-binding winged helix-turn-helix (wHTH) protein
MRSWETEFMPDAGPFRYAFDDFELDVINGELRKSGTRVKLQIQPFRVLTLLVAHAGQVVSRDEIRRHIWTEDTFVDYESGLNYCIRQIRIALADGSAQPRYIETSPRRGYRFVASVEPDRTQPAAMSSLSKAAGSDRPGRQSIRFCTTPEGVRIAYSETGAGPPLVKAANWLNHLEFEWHSPIWRHWIKELSAHHHLIRYDERGNGLSDWNVPELSFDAFLGDLESVVETAGVERFALLGISQGGAVAAAYAARHPERVSHLVLYGTYGRGWELRGDLEDIESRRAMLTLIRLGWGAEHPLFRQLWTSRYIPDGTADQWEWFNQMQRISTSPEIAARLVETWGRIDVTGILRDIRVPTIVFHCEHDLAVPFEEGRRLASAIPGSQFVPLPSRNHLVLADEPAWGIFLQELGAFLGWSAQPALAGLSAERMDRTG